LVRVGGLRETSCESDARNPIYSATGPSMIVRI
jgi:hypothetical protein